MSAPSTLPEAVVVAVLVAASLGITTPPTANANAFSGPEQPPGAYIPEAAVFVVCYGGAYPMTLLGNTQDIRAFDVQVLVRGNVDNLDTTRTLAWNIWTALQRKLAPSTGYIDILCKQSGPIYMGQDDTEHVRFSVNASLRFQG
jgi:hypothetical protein